MGPNAPTFRSRIHTSPLFGVSLSALLFASSLFTSPPLCINSSIPKFALC